MSMLSAAVLATLCAIVAAHCGSDSYGSTRGYSVKLGEVFIPRGVPSVRVQIPATEACYPARPIGTYLEVCEDSILKSPRVHLYSLYEGHVMRRSSLRRAAEVHTTVFCSDWQGPGQPGVHAKNLRPTITAKGAEEEEERIA